MWELKKLISNQNLDLLQETLDALSSGVAILDKSGKIILVNKAWENLAAKGLLLLENPGLGTNFLEACNRNEGDRAETAVTIATGIAEILAGKSREFQLEYSLKQEYWLLMRAKSIEDPGNLLRLAVSFENVTTYKQKESALSYLVQATSGVTGQDFFRVLVQDLAKLLQFQYVFLTECLNELKPATVRILAFWCKNEYGENFEYSLRDTPCEQVFGKEACYYPQDIQILFLQDGDLVLLEAEGYIGVPMFDSFGNIIGHLLAMDDRPIEDPSLGLALMQIFAPRAAVELLRQRKQEQLIEDGLRDRLTDLPNRNLFEDRLCLALKRFQRNEQERFAVLLLNLDGFDLFCDRLGIKMTQQLKVKIVQRIQDCLRDRDTLASLGANELAILLEEIDSLSDASVVVDRIQQVLIPPIHLDNNEIFASLTIGIIISDSSKDSVDAFFEDRNIIWSGSLTAHPDLRPTIKTVSFTARYTT